LKNDKFAEVNPKAPLTEYERIREAQRDGLQKSYDEVGRYINDNRLDTLQVILAYLYSPLKSKIGPLSQGNLPEASAALTEDVFKDFIKDNEELWGLLGTILFFTLLNAFKMRINKRS